MPLTPAPEEVFTIAPPPCLSSKGISCFMQRNTLRRFISTTVPLLFEIGRWRDRLFYAGGVEGEVEAPEGLDRLLQRGLHIVVPRHIAFDRERAPAGLLDHACRFLVA